MNIYVGNLPFETTEDDLTTAFNPYGTVGVARYVVNRVSRSLSESQPLHMRWPGPAPPRRFRNGHWT